MALTINGDKACQCRRPEAAFEGSPVKIIGLSQHSPLDLLKELFIAALFIWSCTACRQQNGFEFSGHSGHAHESNAEMT